MNFTGILNGKILAHDKPISDGGFQKIFKPVIQHTHPNYLIHVISVNEAILKVLFLKRHNYFGDLCEPTKQFLPDLRLNLYIFFVKVLHNKKEEL